MTSPIDVLISRDELMFLGQQLGGQHSAISPFIQGQAVPDLQQALSPTLVNPDGSLKQDVYPAFKTLATAQSYGLVVYSGEDANFEAGLYYPPQGTGHPAALMLSNEGLRLQSPPHITNWVNTLGQFVGESVVKPVEFEMELAIQEAWLLFAVIDCTRRQIMKSMAEDGNLEQISIPVDDVVKTLTNDNLQWLSAYFAAAHEHPQPDESSVPSIIQTLDAKSLLSYDGNRITPTEKTVELAATFLTIDGHVRLQAATLDNRHQPINSLIWGVQGRGNAFLMWTPDETGVSIFCLSSAQTMVIISSLLEDPAAQFTEGALPLAPAASQAAAPRPDENAPAEYSPPKKRKRKWWRIVMIVLAFLVVCYLLAFIADWIYWGFF